MKLSHLTRIAALAALLAFGSGTAALAHAELVTAAPAADSALEAAPEELRLEFSDRIELAFSEVTLTDASGTEIALGELALDPADDKVVVVTLPEAAAAGDYTVAWSVVSADGHKVEGSYEFTVAGQ